MSGSQVSPQPLDWAGALRLTGFGTFVCAAALVPLGRIATLSIFVFPVFFVFPLLLIAAISNFPIWGWIVVVQEQRARMSGGTQMLWRFRLEVYFPNRLNSVCQFLPYV